MPRNDAWSYSRTAEILHETGHYELIRYGRMMLVGHIAWVQPFLSIFDDREVAGNVAGIVACAIAVTCFYLLGCRFVTRRRALAAVAVLAVFPGFAATVPTYMTEPTALALTAGSLLLAVGSLRAEGSRARVLLGAAVLTAVAGFSVREFGIAVLIAVIGAALCRKELRAPAALVGALGLVACAGVYTWHERLPNLEPTELRLTLTGGPQVIRALCTLGLGLLPLTFLPALGLLRRVREERHVAAGLGIGVTVVLLALVSSFYDVAGSRTLLASNMLTRFGVSSQSLAVGARPVVIPDVVWAAINLAAAVGAVCLALVVAELVAGRIGGRLAGGDWVLLELFVVAHLAVVLIFGLLGPLFEERYLWPAVVPLALLVLRVQEPAAALSRPLRAAPWALGGALAVIAVVLAQDSGSYDGGRWLAAERLVAAGAAPQDIDAGLEWVGAHASAPRSLAEGQVDTLHPYYELFYPRARCWVVSNERLAPADYELAATRTYRSHLGLTERTLYVHRRRNCG